MGLLFYKQHYTKLYLVAYEKIITDEMGGSFIKLYTLSSVKSKAYLGNLYSVMS